MTNTPTPNAPATRPVPLIETLRRNAARTYNDPDRTDEMLRQTIMDACDEADRLRAENAALQRWKDEQLLVESEWDAQAVGEALGLLPGSSIRAGVLPGIQAQAREIARLREALDHYASDYSEFGDVARAALYDTTPQGGKGGQ